MRFVQLENDVNLPIWLNADQITYIESSTGSFDDPALIHFVGGGTIKVLQSREKVIALIEEAEKGAGNP